jgi:protein SCO1/2
LTGTEETIHTLTEAAGFQYVYDEEMDMYFHPTGVVVTTPEGQIARYIDGIGYDPLSLRLALVEASNRQIGTINDAVGLLCFQYDEVTGKYSLAVMRLVQVAGVITAGILGTVIFLLKRREKKTGGDR